MPAMNPKNAALGAAGQDLGLGDLLQQQLSDQEEERKKKLLAQAGNQARGLGNGMNGLASQTLLGAGFNG